MQHGSVAPNVQVPFRLSSAAIFGTSDAATGQAGMGKGKAAWRVAFCRPPLAAYALIRACRAIDQTAIPLSLNFILSSHASFRCRGKLRVEGSVRSHRSAGCRHHADIVSSAVLGAEVGSDRGDS